MMRLDKSFGEMRKRSEQYYASIKTYCTYDQIENTEHILFLILESDVKFGTGCLTRTSMGGHCVCEGVRKG